MDTPTLRKAVKQVINHYAQFTPSHGTIRLDPVFDEKNDRYALMQTGWNRGQRVRGNLIYITIENNQIQIEYDGIEQGIAQDISAQGIPPTQIIDLFQNRSPLNLATIEPVI